VHFSPDKQTPPSPLSTLLKTLSSMSHSLDEAPTLEQFASKLSELPEFFAGIFCWAVSEHDVKTKNNNAKKNIFLFITSP
jgi:hypothetical protein